MFCLKITSIKTNMILKASFLVHTNISQRHLLFHCRQTAMSLVYFDINHEANDWGLQTRFNYSFIISLQRHQDHGTEGMWWVSIRFFHVKKRSRRIIYFIIKYIFIFIYRRADGCCEGYMFNETLGECAGW